METSEFFKQLGLGDPELNEAREWVSYRNFEDAVPDVLLLEEFVNTVFKKAASDDARPHLWFSKRYMISKYFETNIAAEDEYIVGMVAKIRLIEETIRLSDDTKYIHQFLNVLTEYVTTKRMVVSASVLNYLNTLFKTKGRV